MYNITGPTLVHTEAAPAFSAPPVSSLFEARTPLIPMRRDAPTRAPLAGKLAWFSGLSLAAVGAMGLNLDGTLAIFDSTCVTVGLLALPPVTSFVRARLPFDLRGWQHFLLGAAAVAAALALNVSGIVAGPAPYPVATNVKTGSFGAVALGDDTLSADRIVQQKADYLVEVAAQIKAMDNERALAADLGATATEYDDQMLDARAQLIARRTSFALTPAETALVNKLSARVWSARQAMAPVARRDYVAALNGPLATYGLSARMVGDDVIEFVGLALADPQRRQMMLTLTQADRTRLGFVDVRFAASEAASLQQNTPVDAGANLGPAAALEPRAGEAPPA